VHEVIIESPDHVISLSALSEDQVRLVLHAYQDRLRQLGTDRRLAYAQIFKNSGAAAGASLEHAHSQLIATPVVPTQVQNELAKSRAYFEQHGRCVFCAMLDEEQRVRTRIVSESPNFIAFCPFASQFPYEVWLLPRRHQSHFESSETGELGEFARLVRDVVGRIECVLSRPAFNYLIHTSPFDTSSLEHYHWHLEFSPRLIKTAGFEWGAGDYINTVSPETAARALRAGA
jgi:UDPglucose--hexose-1-phosphate uridylyltransferase